jgi:hypothetical protein
MTSESVIIVCFLIVVIAIQLVITYKIFYGFKKLLEEKNLRLIQLYLDAKFIRKITWDNLNISDTKKFCESVTRDVIPYFNLEDIIITSLDTTTQPGNNSLRKDVIKFTRDNLEQIDDLFQNRGFIQLKFDLSHGKFELYISPIKDTVSQGLIICVENAPVLLSENELSSLEVCINLMKARLAQLP